MSSLVTFMQWFSGPSLSRRGFIYIQNQIDPSPHTNHKTSAKFTSNFQYLVINRLIISHVYKLPNPPPYLMFCKWSVFIEEGMASRLLTTPSVFKFHWQKRSKQDLKTKEGNFPTQKRQTETRKPRINIFITILKT